MSVVVAVVAVVVVVVVVEILAKVLEVNGAVQEVIGEVQVVAEMLISVDPGLLVAVVISGTVRVEVESLLVSSATEVTPVEACATNIGVAQVVADNRRLALVKTPSSTRLCLI